MTGKKSPLLVPDAVSAIRARSKSPARELKFRTRRLDNNTQRRAREVVRDARRTDKPPACHRRVLHAIYYVHAQRRRVIKYSTTYINYYLRKRT